jgi:hypothetical protein
MSSELSTLLSDMAVFLAALFIPLLILGFLMLFGQVWSLVTSLFQKRSAKPNQSINKLAS